MRPVSKAVFDADMVRELLRPLPRNEVEGYNYLLSQTRIQADHVIWQRSSFLSPRPASALDIQSPSQLIDVYGCR
jgi:hypothetical protein